jgi:hypothetical protein
MVQIEFRRRLDNDFEPAMIQFGNKMLGSISIRINAAPGKRQALPVDGDLQVLLPQRGKFQFDDEFPGRIDQDVGTRNPKRRVTWFGRHGCKLMHGAEKANDAGPDASKLRLTGI